MTLDGKYETTFWSDFTIADHFSEKAVRDTYKRAFKEWKSNVMYVTELAVVLNHKIWQHYHHNNEPLARVYDELWRECDSWCWKHLKGKDADYYFSRTD